MPRLSSSNIDKPNNSDSLEESKELQKLEELMSLDNDSQKNEYVVGTVAETDPELLD